MSYTTLAAVARELRIDDGTDSDILAGYVALAQRIIEANRPLGTGRVFEASADTTRYLDAPTDASADPDGPSYTLLFAPAIGELCAITSVVNGDGTTIPPTAYVTLPRYTTPYFGVRLKQNAGYTWTYTANPEGAIAITGRWAYSTVAPTDIQRAATRIAVWLYRSRDNANADQSVQTDQGIILPNKMPVDVRQIIEAYWTVM